MKRLFFYIAAIFLSGNIAAQTLAPPINFESTTIAYTFTNFDGGGATVIYELYTEESTSLGTTRKQYTFA